MVYLGVNDKKKKIPQTITPSIITTKEIDKLRVINEGVMFVGEAVNRNNVITQQRKVFYSYFIDGINVTTSGSLGDYNPEKERLFITDINFRCTNAAQVTRAEIGIESIRGGMPFIIAYIMGNENQFIHFSSPVELEGWAFFTSLTDLYGYDFYGFLEER